VSPENCKGAIRTDNKPLQTDEPLAAAVSGFAALDAAAFGLRVVRLVPAGAGPSTIVETL
jgi:hypothetical protein